MSALDVAWYCAACALLVADLRAERQLAPYMATLILTSFAIEFEPAVNLDYVLRCAPLVALVFVLASRVGWTRPVKAAACVAALGVLFAGWGMLFAGPEGAPNRFTALFLPQVLVALFTYHAYVPAVRAHTARPRMVDVSLLAFAALDFAVGLAGLVQIHLADLQLWEFWPALSILTAVMFLALAMGYEWRRCSTR
ncbi:MAG: hypothetical protein AAGH15_05140 [Myxococcota bacterium]